MSVDELSWNQVACLWRHLRNCNIARSAGWLYKTALFPVWKKKHWTCRTQFLPGVKNIKYVKLVEPYKIPLHSSPMFPLIFWSLCAHKISFVQHFTKTIAFCAQCSVGG